MTPKQITIAVAAAMLSAGAYAGGGEQSKQQPRAEGGSGAMTQSQPAQSQPGQEQAKSQSARQAGAQGGQQHAQAQSPEVVKQAQQALKQKGIDAGPVDGQWGPLTQQGVKQFQQQNQIQATGQLDQQTLASLGIEQSASAGAGSRGAGKASEPSASSGSSSSGSNGSAPSASGGGAASSGSSAESPRAPAGASSGSSGSQKY